MLMQVYSLSFFVRYLLHNEQLVQRLADSYPFRRAAQLTASLILRGKSLGQESLELMSTSSLLRKLVERLSQTGRTTDRNVTFSGPVRNGT
uniref:Uncharacterized protein n=1 Tax=Ixodes ricinus TaxID=34613 RepID=A0A0K8RK77_IXORI